MSLALSILARATSLSDPAGSSVLIDAARWVNDVLLGTVATSLAVVAVAVVGFMMLGGRINWRRGASVIFGCFLLFGAKGIVTGFMPQGDTFPPTVATAPSPLTPSEPSPEQQVYDPYAGAAQKRD